MTYLQFHPKKEKVWYVSIPHILRFSPCLLKNVEIGLCCECVFVWELFMAVPEISAVQLDKRLIDMHVYLIIGVPFPKNFMSVGNLIRHVTPCSPSDLALGYAGPALQGNGRWGLCSVSAGLRAALSCSAMTSLFCGSSLFSTVSSGCLLHRLRESSK